MCGGFPSWSHVRLFIAPSGLQVPPAAVQILVLGKVIEISDD